MTSKGDSPTAEGRAIELAEAGAPSCSHPLSQGDVFFLTVPGSCDSGPHVVSVSAWVHMWFLGGRFGVDRRQMSTDC